MRREEGRCHVDAMLDAAMCPAAACPPCPTKTCSLTACQQAVQQQPRSKRCNAHSRLCTSSTPPPPAPQSLGTAPCRGQPKRSRLRGETQAPGFGVSNLRQWAQTRLQATEGVAHTAGGRQPARERTYATQPAACATPAVLCGGPLPTTHCRPLRSSSCRPAAPAPAPRPAASRDSAASPARHAPEAGAAGESKVRQQQHAHLAPTWGEAESPCCNLPLSPPSPGPACHPQGTGHPTGHSTAGTAQQAQHNKLTSGL